MCESKVDQITFAQTNLIDSDGTDGAKNRHQATGARSLDMKEQ